MLVLQLRRGDPIAIHHGNEQIMVHLEDHPFKSNLRIVFDGPQSFKIVRLRAEANAKRKEQKS